MGVPSQRAAATDDAIELLSVAILDEQRRTVEHLLGLANRLEIGLGWHYLLDLPWILDRIDTGPGTIVLDAGAGTGVIQWYLALQGCDVISVDRMSRALLPERFRAMFRVRGLRSDDLLPPPANSTLRAVRRPLGKARRLFRLGRAVSRGYRRPRRAKAENSDYQVARAMGEIVIYNQDLGDLTDIPDESVDAIVSVSALEHNDAAALPAVVAELMRVLKPRGRLVATLGASAGEDWFHEPSKGWCYSEASIRRIFELAPGVPSNYSAYGALLAEIRRNAELRDNLGMHYFESGDNGMPWGKWDPQYLSVGICKVKPWPATEG